MDEGDRMSFWVSFRMNTEIIIGVPAMTVPSLYIMATDCVSSRDHGFIIIPSIHLEMGTMASCEMFQRRPFEAPSDDPLKFCPWELTDNA
jgi:hypothetical protein